MTPTATITRRRFITVVTAAGGSLVLAMQLPFDDRVLARAAAAPFAPNVWLRIDPDGTVTITVARSELGQGAHTAMPMLVAEELEADWSKIRIEQAVADPQKYGSMTTGGSSSVRGGWERLRRAGATAREMLVSAAAQAWQVDRSTCRAENGAVLHVPTGRKLDYGALTATASTVPVPKDVPLKEAKDFRLLGRRVPRLDTPSKVAGKAIFGLDMRLPGMLFATVARCETFGGKAKRFDATRALAVRGVRRVLEIPSGIAVLADSTWAALRGREALQVEWDVGPHAHLDSATLRRTFAELASQSGAAARRAGDAAKALASSARKLEAVYELPFLAHATLEPMNCVADVKPDGADIWAPTQAPQWAQQAVAGTLGLPLAQVKIHTTLSGGAFGRRLMYDFVVEAAQLSRAAGSAVQVVWTREDDMRHDFYRPASLHHLAAALDATQNLTAWTHRIVAPSIMVQAFPDEKQDEYDAVDGAANLPYTIPNILVDYVRADTPVPVGWWRSVYNTQNAFVNECFLDEIAVACGHDPWSLRQRLLPASARLRRALEHEAILSAWRRPPAPGRSRGIATHECFGTAVAQVAEVSIDGNGRVRVHRIVCALDCGPIVNLDTVEAQVEGAIAYGLGAVLHGEVTLNGGGVQQSNFDDYAVLSADEMPEVEVHVVPSTDAVGGIGEPGLPPVAPAVCNAVFAATGRRVRRLPLRPAELGRG